MTLEKYWLTQSGYFIRTALELDTVIADAKILFCRDIQERGDDTDTTAVGRQVSEEKGCN